MATGTSWTTHPIVGGIIGVFAGGLAIMLIEVGGHMAFGTADVVAAPEQVTTPMMVSVLVAWVVGAFVAGTVATLWSRSRSVLPGLIAGLVLLSGSVATMLTFPHPWWMMAGALVLMPVAAWCAGRLRTAERSLA